MKGLVVVYITLTVVALVEWCCFKQAGKGWLSLYWLSATGLMISVLGMSLLGRK